MLPIRKQKQVLWSGLCLPFQFSAFHVIHSHVEFVISEHCILFSSLFFPLSEVLLPLFFIWLTVAYHLILVSYKKCFNSPSLYPPSPPKIYSISEDRVLWKSKLLHLPQFTDIICFLFSFHWMRIFEAVDHALFIFISDVYIVSLYFHNCSLKKRVT